MPTNDAITILLGGDDPPDLSDDDVVRDLFGAHLQNGALLDDPASVTEVVVANGGPQPIDSSVNPITIGGVRIINVNNPVDGVVVHLVDRVLPIQP